MFADLSKQYFIGVMLALLGTLFFSTKSIFIKKVYQYGVDPVTLMFLRMLMALPFYFLIYLLNKSRMPSLSIKDFGLICITGLLGYYLASYLDLNGLLYISASFERMILYLFPSFVLVISIVFLKHKINITEIIAFVVCYFGISVIYLQDFGAGGNDVTYGMVLVLGSALAFSIFVVLSGQLIGKVGSVQFTSLSMMSASVAVFVHYFFNTQIDFSNVQREVYYLTFVLAVFCTVLPSYLINMSVKLLGATKVAIMGTISPVFTIALAYFFLQEVSTLMHMFGFALVLLGISIITLAKRKPVEAK